LGLLTPCCLRSTQLSGTRLERSPATPGPREPRSDRRGSSQGFAPPRGVDILRSWRLPLRATEQAARVPVRQRSNRLAGGHCARPPRVNGRGLCAARSCSNSRRPRPSPPASGGDHTAGGGRELERVLTPGATTLIRYPCSAPLPTPSGSRVPASTLFRAFMLCEGAVHSSCGGPSCRPRARGSRSKGIQRRTKGERGTS
jgi:hypothetical protein